MTAVYLKIYYFIGAIKVIINIEDEFLRDIAYNIIIYFYIKCWLIFKCIFFERNDMIAVKRGIIKQYPA